MTKIVTCSRCRNHFLITLLPMSEAWMKALWQLRSSRDFLLFRSFPQKKLFWWLWSRKKRKGRNQKLVFPFSLRFFARCAISDAWTSFKIYDSCTWRRLCRRVAAKFIRENIFYVFIFQQTNLIEVSVPGKLQKVSLWRFFLLSFRLNSKPCSVEVRAPDIKFRSGFPGRACGKWKRNGFSFLFLSS